MERELATLDDWDPSHLTERRQRLIKWALERWQIESDNVGDVQAMPADQDDLLDDLADLEEAL